MSLEAATLLLRTLGARRKPDGQTIGDGDRGTLVVALMAAWSPARYRFRIRRRARIRYCRPRRFLRPRPPRPREARPVTVHRPPRGAPAAIPKKRKLSKRTVKVIAWIGGALAFALPWAVIQAVPRPAVTAGPQLVVVPTGSHVVIERGATGGSGAVVVRRAGRLRPTARRPLPRSRPPGGSAPPPPGRVTGDAASMALVDEAPSVRRHTFRAMGTTVERDRLHRRSRDR